MTVVIERATLALHKRLSEIAYAAKRHWGYPESWIETWGQVLTITPDFIASNHVFVARVGFEIAGFCALIQSGAKVSLEHMWIDPEFMGRGIGRDLLSHALKAAATLNVDTVEIESDPNAEGFYKKMGARRIGEVSSELEGQRRVLPLLVIDTPRLDSRSPESIAN